MGKNNIHCGCSKYIVFWPDVGYQVVHGLRGETVLNYEGLLGGRPTWTTVLETVDSGEL